MNQRHVDFLPGAALAVVVMLRPLLEATMARHMALEIPLLFLTGWLVSSRIGQRLTKQIAPWNAYGVPALVYASLAGLLWMMPVALDLAVLNPAIGLLKLFTIVLAGVVVGASWREAGLVIQSFFVFNAVSMLVAGGLLYGQAPDQLCSVYLVGQQAIAGDGLIAWALVILAFWFYAVSRDPMIRGDESSSPANIETQTAPP
jgi:hypothetical protein